jgi:hypothetical protein
MFYYVIDAAITFTFLSELEPVKNCDVPAPANVMIPQANRAAGAAISALFWPER